MRPDRSLLLSLAHPDDEAFMAGGTVPRYAGEGVTVSLVTATLGQAGSSGNPSLCSPEELGAMRHGELQEAARLMGVTALEVLAYRDKELAAAPMEEMRLCLVRLLRRHRPTVVMTFDPNGVNGHPDHMAISRFTLDAVTAAADGRWHPEAGPAHTTLRVVWPSPMPCFDLGSDADPGRLPGVDFLLDIQPWQATKAAALRAHRTQHQGIDRLFFADGKEERALRWEAFRQAWGPSVGERPARDLFVGL